MYFSTNGLFHCCFSLTGLDGAIPVAGSPLAGKLFVVLGAGGAGLENHLFMVLHRKGQELLLLIACLASH